MKRRLIITLAALFAGSTAAIAPFAYHIGAARSADFGEAAASRFGASANVSETLAALDESDCPDLGAQGNFGRRGVEVDCQARPGRSGTAGAYAKTGAAPFKTATHSAARQPLRPQRGRTSLDDAVAQKVASAGAPGNSGGFALLPAGSNGAGGLSEAFAPGGGSLSPAGGFSGLSSGLVGSGGGGAPDAIIPGDIFADNGFPTDTPELVTPLPPGFSLMLTALFGLYFAARRRETAE